MSEAKVDADMGAWRDVFSKFDKAVEECFDVDMLVKCLLEDDSWYIPFDSRIKLMEKAKSEPPRDCRRLNILREYDNEKTSLHS